MYYLSAADVLQLEELLHENLVDFHQDHAHSVSVDQRQVSVTLDGQTDRFCNTGRTDRQASVTLDGKTGRSNTGQTDRTQ